MPFFYDHIILPHIISVVKGYPKVFFYLLRFFDERPKNTGNSALICLHFIKIKLKMKKLYDIITQYSTVLLPFFNERFFGR